MELPRKRRNKGFSQTLVLMGLGAGLMYLFDPDMGPRRRALLQDKMVRLRNETENFIDAKSEDLKNRAMGMAAEVAGRFRPEAVTDHQLAARVKSSIGRTVISNPGAIDVNAQNGVVTLRGPVLAEEVQRLLSRVKTIQGVKNVQNQLHVLEDRSNIPSLQTSKSAGESTVKRSRTTGQTTRKTAPKKSRTSRSKSGQTDSTS